MPRLEETAASYEELTTEREENAKPDYLDAVDAAVEKALASVERGDLIPADAIRKKHGLED